MMKQLVLIYLLVGLLIFALLAVLNYGYGAGYVYIYWRDWQFQSSVWGLILLFILVSLFAQLLWIFARRYLAREHGNFAGYIGYNGICLPNLMGLEYPYYTLKTIEEQFLHPVIEVNHDNIVMDASIKNAANKELTKEPETRISLQ